MLVATFQRIHGASLLTRCGQTTRLRTISRQQSARRTKSTLTHVDDTGAAHMVSIAKKSPTQRLAVARGTLETTPQAIRLIRENGVKKGDAMAVARVAGIMAAKQTSTLIPLCHNIPLSSVEVDIELDDEGGRVVIGATAETFGNTGVEMEAMVACSTALLTMYDMLKAVDKRMVMTSVRVVKKTGGKSGDWVAE